MPNRLLWAAIVPIVVVSLMYIITIQMNPAFAVLSGRRIAIVIAHPDDEAMFFAPSVIGLTQPKLGNDVQLICLSTGNADGIGHIRKHELVDSAQVLGLDIGSNPSAVVSVLDDPRFPDSITTDWSTTEVRDVLLNVWTTRPFDTIITFDEDGVSGHPNHRALYHGAIAFVNSVRGSQAKDGSDSGNPVALYTLPSYGLIRKYSGVLDIITTFATKGRGAVSPVVTGKLPTKVPSLPPVVLSINGPQQYRSAREAMVKAHKSQMRWFRWGWISLSRYMFVNDLHLYGQVERPKIESVTV